MAQLGCSCFKQVISNGNGGSGKVKASMTMASSAKALISGSSNISEHAAKDHSVSSKIKGYGAVRSLAQAALNIRHNTQGTAAIESVMSFEGMAFRGNIRGVSKVGNDFADKFNNKPETEFNSVQRLYPIADVASELDGKHIVKEDLSTNDLYQSIDEGIYTGNYTAPSGNSILISDENTYIQPSSIATNGLFNYQCEMTPPVITPIDSLLVIRASAPMSNFQSLGPPKYTLYDITLSDPEGNVIIEYEDFDIIGDNGFTTYFTQPKINNTVDFRNDPYPVLGEPSDYVLNININSSCHIDDPFSPQYNEGYQDTCTNNEIPETSLVPTPSLKISAIEICNSGSLVGLLGREALPFTIKIDEYGDNISRRILPVNILDSNYVSTVWPNTPSVWESSETLYENLVGRNTSPSGISVINGLMNSRTGSITLVDTGEIADSGKLNMMFSHQVPKTVTGLTGGDFSFGRPSQGLQTASVDQIPGVDDWFIVRGVRLLLKARKAPSSRDYVLDVVGYSDDKILNVTPKQGGFLQNPEGVGNVPLASGFQGVDDLAISSETISDKSEYFEKPFGNQGGDHYKLTTAPVVDSVDWKDYEIPLAIYEDNVTIGKSTDYTMASYFEKLYLDIYPLPLGAELADIRLEIDYGPSNALMMHSLGHETRIMSDGNVVIFPSAMKSVDSPLNSNVDEQPLSLISDIPQGFGSPDTLKTNYSRRWRGLNSDILTGAFDPLAYDLSFNNPPSSHPFNKMYLDFEDIDGVFAISKPLGAIDIASSGQITGGTFANKLFKNVGQRFNSTKKYSSSPRAYKSIDWAEASHPLEGKITDGYKNALILDGGARFNYGSHGDLADGFSIFVRFTPDDNVNLSTGGFTRVLNSYSGATGFRLIVAEGYLTTRLFAQDGSTKKCVDTIPITDYSFPLSVLITYSEHGDQQLRMYTDNELADASWDHFRDIGESVFVAASSTADIKTDNDMIISEFGLSIPCKVVASNPDKRSKETTVSALFDSFRSKFWKDGQDYTDDRYKLWDYVNDDIKGWQIGAFNYEQFNQAYDQYTKRSGDESLLHEFSTDGSAYSDITDMQLPSSVNTSGISYHSQIENDMLRFHIADITNLDEGARLWSPRPRISKNIPRDYKFEERAFVVESVVEHESDVQIPWPWDGYVGSQNFGPKIIVSLYSKAKEPNSFETPNWGLISRKSHYIHPVNDSLIRISTTFNYDDLTDVESEPWANFDQSKSTTELASKYFTSDINEMFVQYDIVYPSDTAFKSTVKLYTTHIGLENAILESADIDNSLNLHASGVVAAREVLDLNIEGHIELGGVVNLMTDGTPMLYASGDMPLFAASAYFQDHQLPMYVHTVGTLGFGGFFGSMFGVSAPPVFDMSIVGGLPAANAPLPMTTQVSLFDNLGQGNLSMFVSQKGFQSADTNPVTLNTRGANVTDTVAFESINFSVTGNTDILPSGDMNLFIEANPPPFQISSSVGLVSITNTAFDPNSEYQVILDWTGNNPGRGITFADQESGVAFLELDDEIRGVQTICWGTCSDGGTCIQSPIITHGIEWYDGSCIEGGVLRTIRTYTNPEASGFQTSLPYVNNFYGIRKYTGLQPYSLYDVTITGRTASNKIIDVPALATEWEYGNNDRVAYSGVKIVEEADRHLDDHYGKAVEVTDELMFIGSPNYTLQDSTGYDLEDAGAVFVYRRNPEPSGTDWSNQYDKAGWSFEQKLELPEGFRRDSYIDVSKTFTGTNLRGSERIWSVGQEGRKLGNDISASITDREIVAVSAPGALFSRRFPQLQTEPINVAMFVITNEFIPVIKIPNGRTTITLSANTVKAYLDGKDVEFTYFSDPSTRFNVNMLIVEPIIGVEEATPPFPGVKPDFITKVQIERHLSYDRLSDEFQTKDDKILQQMKDAYHAQFPLVPDQIHSGIPPILGIYVDNSASLRERAVQPATDRFIEYWKNFTFENGLKDFSGLPASGHVTYVKDTSENWINQSIALFDEVLNTGNMIEFDYYKLFANGVGPDYYQSDVTEANTPPASGGAAFIFEKFDNGWCPIQRIDSPTELNSVYPDHFAHAVSLSKDGSSLVVGSPYINEAVQYFERDKNFDDRAKSSIGLWLSENTAGSPYLSTLYGEHEDRVQASGTSSANKYLYNNISPSGRYQYLLDYDLQEYRQTFEYTLSDAYPGGTWDFLADLFMPTPRLGYSVAINEDGTTIAAGSPTDSLNLHKSIPVWYRPGVAPQPDGWQSSVNAGSVSVWNTRRLYPHNKAIQYGRFGNLHEILNSGTDPEGTYDHMGDIYTATGTDFEKMAFDKVDIPEDAGLMFLITPASGALSDEILDNIEDWLALGDRHLVVVGDDPLYEASGIYLNTNNIVNDLLRKIGSRLVIQPARNVYEACISGVPYQLNALAATPNGGNGIPKVGSANRLVGSGYGDIRLYDTDFGGDTFSCGDAGNFETVDERFPPYWMLNQLCNMSKAHLGDLRAKWTECCANDAGGTIIFTNDLSYSYGTYRAGCRDEEFTPPYRPTYEPIALMSAGETPPPYERVIPAVPERIKVDWVETGQTVIGERWDFAEEAESGLAFQWTDSQESGISSVNINFGLTPSPSRFIDPTFYNGRDGIIQARATTNVVEKKEQYIYQDPWAMIVEEEYEDTGSTVVLVSSVSQESKTAIDSNRGDTNQNMYANLVGKNANGGSVIAQLGGWTGKLGFKSGYSKSVLYDIFRRNGNAVTQNVTMEELNSSQNGYNVAWIANTSETMSENDLALMKQWLSLGNKKLVITFGHDENLPDPFNSVSSSDIAQATRATCESLGIKSKPSLLPGKNRFANLAADGSRTDSTAISITDNYVGTGFVGLDSSIDNFNLVNLVNPFNIDIAEDAVLHAYFMFVSVIDDEYINKGIPELVSGTAKITIPVLPGSGYRLFLDTVSESPAEKAPLYFTIGNAFGASNTNFLEIPALPLPPNRETDIIDIDYISREEVVIDTIDFFCAPVMRTSDKDPEGTVKTRHLDFLVPSDVNEVSVYVRSESIVGNTPESPSPRSQRLVAISGSFCPLIRTNLFRPVFEPVETIIPAIPERIEIVQDELRQISTGSTKYCMEDDDMTYDDGNGIACSGYFYGNAFMDPLIADGPVIVAQEIYKGRPFEAGNNESRVTVISDASLIQGASILNEAGGINFGLIQFLRNLYPQSPNVERGGRQFVEYEKIISQERSSPQKLYSNTGNSGIVTRFQGTSNGIISSGLSLSLFDDKEVDYTGRNDMGVLQVEAGKPSRFLLPYDGPPRTAETIESLIRGQIARFDSGQYTLGGTARFSGVYEGTMYTDAGPRGGVPDIMKDTGHDYLDFDKFPSGYPGDLFGYSISLFGDKLLIGAPFAAYNSEKITEWADIKAQTEPLSGSLSGAIISHNGGAGAAYLYELGSDITTFDQRGIEMRWSLTRKFRPSGINVGQDLDDTTASQAYKYLGLNSYTEEQLKQLSTTTDMFGRSVDIQHDLLVISAPGHDFGNIFSETPAAYQRKSFNAEFDIQEVTYTDLGQSGVRDAESQGVAVLNNGAVFSYQNNIIDWGSKEQAWQDLQKIVPQGYNANVAGASENDMFGSSVSINRSLRVDGDYILAVGTPMHRYGASGDAQELDQAGTVYTHEVMLRSQPPAFAASGSWIKGSLFGDKPLNPDASMEIEFENGLVRDEIKSWKSRVLTNGEGELFFEASGQDIAPRGYVEHRPYIEAIQGFLTQGVEEVGLFRLSVTGRGPETSNDMPLYVGSEGGTVYNDIGMYTGGILGYGSGNMNLSVHNPSGILHTSTVNMVASGAGLNIDTLDLRTRGK
jgi:hypothetical protein